MITPVKELTKITVSLKTINRASVRETFTQPWHIK
jgi:hypothetical protein